jgi:hypothetical protein
MRRALLLVALLAALLPGHAGAQGSEPPCDLRAALEYPREGTTINAGFPLGVEGWAVDRTAPTGTGILSVQAALDVPREDGGTAFVALHTEERPDVARLLGDDHFLFSGYRVNLPTTDLETGPHTLYVSVLTRCGWHVETRAITVLPSAESVAWLPRPPAAAWPIPRSRLLPR